MSGKGEDSDKRREYQLDISDAADLETDAIFLRLSGYSIDGAARWYSGLLKAYQRLTLFPYAYQAVPNRPGIRRMLYGKYRVVYHVIEPEGDETSGVVRILQIYHGVRYTGQ